VIERALSVRPRVHVYDCGSCARQAKEPWWGPIVGTFLFVALLVGLGFLIGAIDQGWFDKAANRYLIVAITTGVAMLGALPLRLRYVPLEPVFPQLPDVPVLIVSPEQLGEVIDLLIGSGPGDGLLLLSSMAGAAGPSIVQVRGRLKLRMARSAGGTALLSWLRGQGMTATEFELDEESFFEADVSVSGRVAATQVFQIMEQLHGPLEGGRVTVSIQGEELTRLAWEQLRHPSLGGAGEGT